MRSDGQVVEYQGGETFRPSVNFIVGFGIFITAVSTALLTILIAMRIYFGIYLHRAAVEHPIWLLAFEGAVVLEGIWVIVSFVRRLVCGFVRISSDGIEYRGTRKISRVGWQEITAAEFTLRGRSVVGIRIHRGSGVKPLKLVMGFFFSKESRERIEMLIRERVPRECQIDRKRRWWW